jgi:hypothetical protein
LIKSIKMRFTTTLTPLALAGNAIVENACTDPIYLCAVGAPLALHRPRHQQHRDTALQPRLGQHRDQDYPHGERAGRPQPQTKFQYSPMDNLYYGLVDVFGDLFASDTLILRPSVDTCNGICCVGL